AAKEVRMFSSLFSKKATRPAPRPNSFLPSLEALEERQVPTVTASFSVQSGVGTVLTLTGADAAENVSLFNDGAGHINATGVVGVLPPGQSPTQAVDKIVVDLKGGNDNLTYHQGSPTSPVTMTRSLTLDIDLGADSDRFQADLFGAIGTATAARSLQIS